MTDPAYLLAIGDSGVLPESRQFTVSNGLIIQDNGPGATFNITTDGVLQELAGLSSQSYGFIVNTASGINVRSLTSSSAVTGSGGDTLSITYPDGNLGNPQLAVINDTSIQQVNVIYNSQPTIVSSRATLNFIPGPGASITIDDNGTGPANFSGQTDITIGIDQTTSAPDDGTYITATNQTSVLPNSYLLTGGNNITLIKNDSTHTVSVNATASAGTTPIIYFNQSIDTTEDIPITIPAGQARAFTFTAPDELLLHLLQNGDDGSGYLLVQANISYTLLASSELSQTLPFTITFDLSTDANPLSPPLTGNQTWYYNSSMVTTPQFNAIKLLNDVAIVTASRLQIWIGNPDPVNAMSLQNFSSQVLVAYLPNGYS